MKLNLPSYIKKVEVPVQKKQESKDESTSQQAESQVAEQQQQESEPMSEQQTVATTPEIPSPKPRTSIQIQKEATTTASTTTSVPSTTSTSSAPCESQQPNEKKSIDDARVCKICYNEELGVVFLPCGHMVACVKCAPGMTTCAVCREPVTMTVRAFFS